MSKKELATGTVHPLPEDMQKALMSSSAAREVWESITPLARNEWICWTISVKKDETRKEHLKILIDKLKKGMRRPCCWIGCIHRTDKPVSLSVQGILDRRSKKSK